MVKRSLFERTLPKDQVLVLPRPGRVGGPAGMCLIFFPSVSVMAVGNSQANVSGSGWNGWGFHTLK